MAVTKKKLAESRDRMRGHQNTCQCFEVSASFDHLSMSPRLVTRLYISASAGLVYQRVQFYLEMLALIVATEIQLFLNENHVRFTRRVHEAGVNIATPPPGDYFNGILNTELPALPLNEPSICRRHTSVKMARLTNFDGKGVQFFY